MKCIFLSKLSSEDVIHLPTSRLTKSHLLKAWLPAGDTLKRQLDHNDINPSVKRLFKFTAEWAFQRRDLVSLRVCCWGGSLFSLASSSLCLLSTVEWVIPFCHMSPAMMSCLISGPATSESNDHGWHLETTRQNKSFLPLYLPPWPKPNCQNLLQPVTPESRKPPRLLLV